MKEWFKENKWIFVGGIVIVAAISTPLILFIVRNHLDQKTFEALGPVGDFFGGTTVGLLTLASMLFVIASISMQKKQLDMQQDELKMQREELAKTREEFELTNKTLTKQQFESTFFNMINLHHNLWKDLEVRRNFFETIYGELRFNYNNFVKKYWESRLISLKNEDPIALKKFLRSIYLNNSKVKRFETELKNINRSEINQELIRKLESNNEEYFNDFSDKFNDEFERREIDDLFIEYMNNPYLLDYLLIENSNRFYYYTFDGTIDYTLSNERFIEDLNDEWTISFMKQIRKETLYEPSILKRNAYEKLYNNKEEEIGHYYRNLYRIVKFIQDENFSTDKIQNEKEQKKYRGILRAQLSSMELLMLFYNVVYSKKGEKFKEILKGTNFFDDHLIESKLLWANDKEELAALK
ncbi:putative phage abortive infection protein [Bacillus sp. BK450]|uniref:putative phage abortive infection protein n=1 Tax=Bacillus sp. BK450 TaxID=2512182 RepID=UPI0010D8DE08|nr:putative phage abortive infection protein [Bacillus sp. BK450]TDU16458.1 putative phage abortive infection protein [Bacillus sp. BK450]